MPIRSQVRPGSRRLIIAMVSFLRTAGVAEIARAGFWPWLQGYSGAAKGEQYGKFSFRLDYCRFLRNSEADERRSLLSIKRRRPLIGADATRISRRYGIGWR